MGKQRTERVNAGVIEVFLETLCTRTSITDTHSGNGGGVYGGRHSGGENGDRSKKGSFLSEEACALPKMNFISYTCVNLVSPHLSLGGKSHSERQLR